MCPLNSVRNDDVTVLILGGTREARDLAKILVAAGIEPMSSLAGRVTHPALPAGRVRSGGFGGPDALASWLRQHSVRVVIDATHPYAERISASAAYACRATGVALIALHRPAWTPCVGDRWIPASSMEEAARLCREQFSSPFLTIGRQQLAAFATDNSGDYVIRCVEKPDVPLPKHHRIILDRGPFTLESEKELLRRYHRDCIVTKNSGGSLTYAKIEAARECEIPVIIVQRPQGIGGALYCTETAEETADYVKKILTQHSHATAH